MDLQTLIVFALILAAAGYLLGRWRKTLALARAPKDGPGCGGGCGCGPEH